MPTTAARIMKYGLKYIVITVILLSPFQAAAASDIRAFHNINQLPYKQIFALPSLDNSPLTERGSMRFNFITNLSNTYDITADSNELIVTDAETLRTSLIFNYALMDNWQIGIEVPYIRHGSGFLDDFIYDWHDFFGMPQNGRKGDTSDRMQMSYRHGTDYLYAISGSDVSGLGDIRINAAHSLSWLSRKLIISSELKFPTGDFDKLTGSGGYDFSVGLTLNDPYSLGEYDITLFAGMAGAFLGDVDGELADKQNNFVLAGRAGIGWQVSDFLQLKAQIDALSPLYDSGIKELGESSLQLTFGTALLFTEHVSVDFSIAEDIKPCTAADVALQLTLVLTY